MCSLQDNCTDCTVRATTDRLLVCRSCVRITFLHSYAALVHFSYQQVSLTLVLPVRGCDEVCVLVLCNTLILTNAYSILFVVCRYSSIVLVQYLMRRLRQGMSRMIVSFTKQTIRTPHNLQSSTQPLGHMVCSSFFHNLI
jgi:hypothetical protein